MIIKQRPRREAHSSIWLICLALLLAMAVPVAATGGSPASPFADDFTLFESGQVRPLALGANGRHLYAVNTPDNRLEIFRIRPDGHPRGPLTRIGSVKVGLEPVAVAVRNRREVWVVNHLSDSVSVVDVTSPQHAHVERTLLVGDEPRDIVLPASTASGRSSPPPTVARIAPSIPSSPRPESVGPTSGSSTPGISATPSRASP